MTNITSVCINPDLIEWIKKHRINFSEYVSHKIIDDMAKEHQKTLSLTDKVEDLKQRKFKLELEERTLTDQQLVAQHEDDKIRERERATLYERIFNDWRLNYLEKEIVAGITKAEVIAEIQAFKDRNPVITPYADALLEEIEDKAWYERQLKLIELEATKPVDPA